jgi:threonine/homoserine/homoserine lactone efflux protein
MLTALNTLSEGIVIGLCTCAPVGPIGLLCIRRTIVQGRLAGLLSVLGASTGDIIYCSVAGLGMTWISQFLRQEKILFQLVGALVLIVLGIVLFFSEYSREKVPQFQQGGLPGAYISTFLLMLANPMPVVLFTSTFAALGIRGWGENFLSAALLVGGVFLGSAAWSPVLVSGASLICAQPTPTQMRWLNRASGALIFGFGLVLGGVTFCRFGS